TNNKRKVDDSFRNNHGYQQQPLKRQNVAQRDCPKLKNKDGGNVNAQGWVYTVGNAEKKGNASRDPDSNVVTGSDDGFTTSLQLSRNSRPPMLDHQDKYMMKAQVHVSKSSAISDIQALPQRKPHC
nr:hypothetical protein [Tanacetum cinerariifolium]